MMRAAALPRARRRPRWLGYGTAGAVFVGTLAAGVTWLRLGGPVPGNPHDRAQIVAGEHLYATHCASCHGKNLEGDPDWQSRLPNGRLRPPPHDDTGHTWHHSDPVLFTITKEGLKPPIAPKGYESDMPAFGRKLSDAEIWAVLAFIKSKWSEDARAHQKWITEDTARK